MEFHYDLCKDQCAYSSGPNPHCSEWLQKSLNYENCYSNCQNTYDQITEEVNFLNCIDQCKPPAIGEPNCIPQKPENGTGFRAGTLRVIYIFEGYPVTFESFGFLSANYLGYDDLFKPIRNETPINQYPNWNGGQEYCILALFELFYICKDGNKKSCVHSDYKCYTNF